MASNTPPADINEILLGYFALGGTWQGYQKQREVKAQLNTRRKKVTDDQYQVQLFRAMVMADATLVWAKKNGYRGKVAKAWWTARPGILSAAVGYTVDSSKNPTDTLIQFTNGQVLGISAKSTKGTGDIGFKNPGVGTVEQSLAIKLKPTIKRDEDAFVKRFGLSGPKTTRKREIRNNPKIITESNDARDTLLRTLRDALYKKLGTMSQPKLRQYILDGWMDARDVIAPPYIKVTGHGARAPFTATLVDPLKDDKSVAVQVKKITIQKVGNDSVGILAGSNRIMKMRVKYESQAMASSVKFSGDPWK